MKEIILVIALSLMLIGCAKLDDDYAKGKEAYTVGKEVVNVIPKDQASSDTLSIIDWFANIYDTTRSWVRGEDNNASAEGVKDEI